MPKVGLTMTEGAITQWHKRAGEHVNKGELLFTFETEKSTLEYESPESGVLLQILVPVGQTVACYTPVAVVGGDERKVESARQAASPRAKLRARELNIDLTQIVGSGPDGAIRERDIMFIANMELDSRLHGNDKAAKATPVALRIAKELGVDLTAVKGTGPDGRITREDVERAAESKKLEVRSEKLELSGESPITNLQSLSPARRVTAQRMAANAQTAPHVTLHTEADATELVNARVQLNAELKDKISYNALLVAICAKALKENPALNASWDEGETTDDGLQTTRVGRPSSIVRRHAAIHIGIAVDTPRGLFVPVVRNCDTKPLVQLHREVNDVIARTLAGKSTLDELSGGTFTITNLGMFDFDGFTPIINLPEAAILGVGRIVKKPVVMGDDKIVVRQMMTLSLSFDHRVADGAPVAKFLQRVKQLIERPFALAL